MTAMTFAALSADAARSASTASAAASASAAEIDASFLAQVEPFRGELIAHCYRMFGSLHEAEDMVQETYLKAWRAFHGFENRSSLRTWMYRIATNTCLTALESRQRRPLPSGLGGASSDPAGALETNKETPWLEPMPDAVLWGNQDADPATAAVTKESVRLAFVAALQHLTAQQRAVVILRDVLAWHANEVAETLNLTVAGVNSTLQRARAQLAKLDPSADLELAVDDLRTRDLLNRYVAAFEKYDVQGIVELLTADAVWEMPPFTGWYQGAENIGTLIDLNCPAQRDGDMRFVPTSSNGRVALALYMRDADDLHRAFQIQLPTVTANGVSHVVAFFDLELFAQFGLPLVLPAEVATAS